MGYAVYWAPATNRWEGYGVPAYCDAPDCTAEIDHGLDYRCEEHMEWALDEDTEEEYEVSEVGCDLTLCDQHTYDDQVAHWGWQPKPNHPDFIRHILTDDSWAEWRATNPAQTATYRRETA